MLNVIMLVAILLSVVMLNEIMLAAILLSVVECHSASYYFTECCYAECH